MRTASEVTNESFRLSFACSSLLLRFTCVDHPLVVNIYMRDLHNCEPLARYDAGCLGFRYLVQLYHATCTYVVLLVYLRLTRLSTYYSLDGKPCMAHQAEMLFHQRRVTFKWHHGRLLLARADTSEAVPLPHVSLPFHLRFAAAGVCFFGTTRRRKPLCRRLLDGSSVQRYHDGQHCRCP